MKMSFYVGCIFSGHKILDWQGIFSFFNMSFLMSLFSIVCDENAAINCFTTLLYVVWQISFAVSIFSFYLKLQYFAISIFSFYLSEILLQCAYMWFFILFYFWFHWTSRICKSSTSLESFSYYFFKYFILLYL